MDDCVSSRAGVRVAAAETPGSARGCRSGGGRPSRAARRLDFVLRGSELVTVETD
jgi:hypothetical protein